MEATPAETASLAKPAIPPEFEDVARRIVEAAFEAGKQHGIQSIIAAAGNLAARQKPPAKSRRNTSRDETVQSMLAVVSGSGPIHVAEVAKALGVSRSYVEVTLYQELKAGRLIKAAPATFAMAPQVPA